MLAQVSDWKKRRPLHARTQGAGSPAGSTPRPAQNKGILIIIYYYYYYYFNKLSK
jgi:hypothetical protein